MTMTKSEFVSLARGSQQNKADAFEEEIDDGLKEERARLSYRIEDGVRIKISSIPDLAVQEEIKRRYKEVGWETVEFELSAEAVYIKLG